VGLAREAHTIKQKERKFRCVHIKSMDECFDTQLAAQQEPLKRALVELVRIPSVCDENAGEHPFGEAVDQALRKALQISRDLGFRTEYGDGGYYGFAEVGDGTEMLGILGHLDVVPAAKLEDWKSSPFDPVEKDGMLYGRGTQDDKGPLLASLFAVKALLDAGVKLNKRVRFIFGTDEETLWRCINRYKENEETPAMGLSPDACFPLIYAEKGLLQLRLEGENRTDLRLSGGSAFNAVPDTMFYDDVLQEELAAKLDQLGFAYEWKDDGIEIRGKAAHAMIPEEGINAIARLCIALCAIGVQSKAITFIARQIGEDPNAARIFGSCSDEPSGKLKLNVGMIHLGDKEQISIDMRIPVTVPKQALVSKLSEVAAAYGLEYKEFDWLGPLYVPKDHPVIETLLKVYRQLSGDEITEPIASGGATYARAFNNCVAFGALFPGELLTEHEPNERVALSSLYRAMKIYAHAIYQLTR
jgi:succinyl-diaminopimelate desuccinylase